jgi:aspartyl-tRNA(Asn)/glutamyl-tRNA(Gln) amidotransferase subunit A
MSDPLGLRPIAELAVLIAGGDVTPLDLVDDVLDRAYRLEPLHAYVTLDARGAREAATSATREISRSGPRGPLHGIPIAIKDNIDVAGLPTRNGSPLMEGHVAASDAAVVERLRDAGAIIVGKTALHEWAMGGTCIRQPGGPVRNPWDPTRVPGGSSGGSAVAVAVGLAVAAIGTDGMGSIRTPAAYCGVIGLKPTYGLVSRYGVLPPTSSPFDHVGPLARSVADARILLEAIAGPDPRDPTSRVGTAEPSDENSLRVGIVESDLLDDVIPEVAAAVAEAVGLMESRGARMERVPLPLLAYAPLLAAATLTESHGVLLPFAAAGPNGFANPDIRYRILATEFVRAADVRRARQLASVLRAEVEAALRDVDVLLLPTSCTPAFPIAATDVRVGRAEVVDIRRPGGQARITTRLGLPFNIAGVPAITLPAPSLVDGLPVGVQLVGRRWGDADLLAAATRLEAAGAHVRVPPLMPEILTADARSS